MPVPSGCVGLLLRPHRLAISLLSCFITLFAGHSGLAEEPVSGRALKAALILRLIDFVEWPPRAKEEKTFALCVIGDEPLAVVLRQSAKPAGANLEVRSYTGLKGVSGCPLMVFGAYDERQVRSFLAAHRGEPILAVGDSDEFMNAGGVMRIRVEGGRVSIDL